MDSGLLRSSSYLKRLVLGGGLRDGSGCGNVFGTKTHEVGSKMTFLQAPDAILCLELLTVAQSGILVFRIRRQLHIPGA